ncbi:putative cardiolipin synthase [Colwellia chukchiensis]|uniref:Putative cardiolipin synthase n=1 Tax=Colwellia chukchiensis TaxID=641665 RepID=A0A1H7MRB8_9GAMM|nr:phospholipase D family protein [Colwellia chukchiensis]SEL13886.1 putative cardiolipin synthase [Colwellia chukchiensis]
MARVKSRISSVSLSQAEAQKTSLGSAIAPLAALHPQQSGIRLLANAKDAFAARMLLALSAEKTLDLQYYIWQKDITGALLFEALTAAAKRGVRVRLLLDDNGINGLDQALSALNRLDNVQVRIFNPFKQRRFKWLGFITDFSRVNRRMHNKSFTVDNSVTVIGGRNIGDDYFGAAGGILRQDLDLMAIGSVVEQVSVDFDKYWASASAFPLEDLLTCTDTGTYSTAHYLPEQITNPKRKRYLDALQQSSLVETLLANQLSFEWKTATMISDDPAKALGLHRNDTLLFHKLSEIIGQPQKSILLVTPYFVPTKAGVKAFSQLASSGVAISVLTNSMQATDVLPVHAGYAKYRKALLKAGVKLYELRAGVEQIDENLKKIGPFGSSASSLHAKTFAIDSKRLFVGSFNFDPRSMHLNTELGFVIDSPVLACQVEKEFYQQVSQTAYQLSLTDKQKITWTETNGLAKTIHNTEPGMTLFSRAALAILNLLPIDWLL